MRNYFGNFVDDQSGGLGLSFQPLFVYIFDNERLFDSILKSRLAGLNLLVPRSFSEVGIKIKCRDHSKKVHTWMSGYSKKYSAKNPRRSGLLRRGREPVSFLQKWWALLLAFTMAGSTLRFSFRRIWLAIGWASFLKPANL